MGWEEHRLYSQQPPVEQEKDGKTYGQGKYAGGRPQNQEDLVTINVEEGRKGTTPQLLKVKCIREMTRKAKRKLK